MRKLRQVHHPPLAFILVVSLVVWLVAWKGEVASVKVVVSGAGPAGLLAARSILDHRPDAEVEIFEKRGDPRTEEIRGFRAYSLGLNIRGRSALQHWPGLWERVAEKGVLSDKFFLHVGGVQLQLRANREGGVPTLLIGRNDLCAVLLEELVERHENRLNLHFGEASKEVDLVTRRCTGTAASTAITYDDLVGADGVNSVVRQAMRTLSEAVDLPGQFQVWVGPCPKNLDPLAVHAMSSKGLTLFSIPRADGRLCSILSWNDVTGPPAFLNETDDLIAQRIAEDFPSFGAPTLETVAQLRHQRTSRATTVRAKQYHDVAGRSLLLGDAAHSTGGTLGQGANSALTDAVILDELLRATGPSCGKSVVEDVGKEFSQLRQPEGLALWKLLQLPPKGLWSLPYLASQGLSGVLSRWTPQVPQAIQSLLSETTTPYTEIMTWMKARCNEKACQFCRCFFPNSKLDRLSNEQVRCRMNVVSLSDELRLQQLSLLGHILRRPPNHPARVVTLNRFLQPQFLGGPCMKGARRIKWNETVMQLAMTIIIDHYFEGAGVEKYIRQKLFEVTQNRREWSTLLSSVRNSWRRPRDADGDPRP